MGVGAGVVCGEAAHVGAVGFQDSVWESAELEEVVKEGRWRWSENVWMPVAVHATLLAGGAYVPTDPTLPVHRKAPSSRNCANASSA